LEAERDSADMLIDLEILKRRTETEETARIIAETWLLLDRYSGTEDLYQWGAWYFILQRNYTESAILLRAATRHNFSGQWMNIHEALQQLHEGYVDAAEETLKAIPPQDANWTIAANLGRILESQRAPARALESYERAAAAVMETDQILASRIQVRIARCLKTLGRIEESRRALNYALNLNPDNLNARLELSRLE
jgi:tetratricopeptide (TPR) repeat protein